MNLSRLRIAAACVLAAVWSASPDRVAYAEEIIRLGSTYAPYQVTLTTEQRKEAAAFARATAGKSPLARMERLAYDYAYGGKGADSIIALSVSSPRQLKSSSAPAG